MKNLAYILLFLLSPLVIFGQESTHSKLPSAELRDSAAASKNVDDSSGFRRQKMRKRMTDSFIDKDGDGINDCRARGMKWSGKGKGMGPGKGKQKGLGRHRK